MLVAGTLLASTAVPAALWIKINNSRQKDADNFAAVAVYAKLAALNLTNNVPDSTWKTLEGGGPWWWVDAAYMGAVAYMQHNQLRDVAADHMDRLILNLWDENDRLFIRDKQNTKKWARGNGWAALGLVEMAERQNYTQRFAPTLKTLLDRVIELQRSDGGWPSHITSNNNPSETSATAALAAALTRTARLQSTSQQDKNKYTAAAQRANRWIKNQTSVLDLCQPIGYASSLDVGASDFCAGLVMLALCA